MGRKSKAKVPKKSVRHRGSGNGHQKEEDSLHWNTVLFPKKGHEERLAGIRPFWRGLSEEARQELLTIKLSELQTKAKLVDKAQDEFFDLANAGQLSGMDLAKLTGYGDPMVPVSQVLQTGLKRARSHNTWKSWKCPDDCHEIYLIDQFRKHVRKCCITKGARGAFPIIDGTATETPAAVQLRNSLRAIHDNAVARKKQIVDDYHDDGPASLILGLRPIADDDDDDEEKQDCTPCAQGNYAGNMSVILMMLCELSQLSEYLYTQLSTPIAVCLSRFSAPDDEDRDVTELFYEDFSVVPAMVLTCMYNWLCRQLKYLSEPVDWDINKDDEAEDADLFKIIHDSDQQECITVNPAFVRYLQGCKIGSDGQPEAKEAGSLDTADGCELDFCFGKVERIPDRMRAQAKQVVGKTSIPVQHNLEVLEDAVGEKSMWMECVTNDEIALKQLEENDEKMMEVLEMHPDMYNTEANAEGFDLPFSVMEFMLTRDRLLTSTARGLIEYEMARTVQERKRLEVQEQQMNFLLERAEREVQEIRQSATRKRGHHETANEAATRKLVNAAKLKGREKILELQKGPHKEIVDKMDALAFKLASQQVEFNKATGHITSMDKLIKATCGLKARKVGAMETAMLRHHFSKDIWPHILDLDGADGILKDVCRSLKLAQQEAEENQAVIQVLERHLLFSVCDDAGGKLGAFLIFPALQDRIEAAARAAAEAEQAERELHLLQEIAIKAPKKKKKKKSHSPEAKPAALSTAAESLPQLAEASSEEPERESEASEQDACGDAELQCIDESRGDSADASSNREAVCDAAIEDLGDTDESQDGWTQQETKSSKLKQSWKHNKQKTNLEERSKGGLRPLLKSIQSGEGRGTNAQWESGPPTPTKHEQPSEGAFAKPVRPRPPLNL